MDAQYIASLQVTLEIPIQMNSWSWIQPTMSVNSVVVQKFTDDYTPISLHIVTGSTQTFESISEDLPYEALKKRRRWQDKAYRQHYMEAAIEQGIAWQIKVNREGRNLSQKALAKLTETGQSAISRAEDEAYGKQNLKTLIKIANAFDCALQIKLTPYSELALDSEYLSPDYLYAPAYTEEMNDENSHQRIANSN